MWSPTHVQVTVQRAKGLLTKGKNGTNDAFVTIALGKEKYQTSVKEKATGDVEWHEECELQIPIQGNTAEIVLTALHRNFMGVDEFLGVIRVPLADFDVYERPKNRWYGLNSKPGKEKSKPRGEIEVKVGFIVKAGSLTDLSKKEKHKSSMGQLSHMAHSVGGSLLSIGTLEKRKGLKKFAKSIGSKISKKGNKDHQSIDTGTSNDGGSIQGSPIRTSRQVAGDADPGVVSDGESEDDFTFDDLSHKSSGSSLNTHQPPVAMVTPTMKRGSLDNLTGRTVPTTPPSKPPRSVSGQTNVDEWEQKLYGKQAKETPAIPVDTLKRRSWENSKTQLTSQPEEEEPVANGMPHVVANGIIPHDEPVIESEEKEMSKLARKFKHFRKGGKDVKLTEAVHNENIIIGGDNNEKMSVRLSTDMVKKYEGKSKEDLIVLLEHQTKKMKDMEDYLDDLLLRVMETTPRILQNPYVGCKTQAKKG